MENLAQKLGGHMAFTVRQHMDQYSEMARAQSWEDLGEFTDANEYIVWALRDQSLVYDRWLNETVNQAVKVAESILFGSVSL